MKAIELSKVSALTPHVKPGRARPLLLTDHGKVVAAIVPADEQDAESMLLSIDPRFNAILKRSRQRLEAEGGLTRDEVRKQLGIAETKRDRSRRSTRSRPRRRSANSAASPGTRRG